MIPKTHDLWCEKYRPQKLDDYIFHDASHQKTIESMIEKRDIGHLLFSGVQGSGKTTIALIMISLLEIDEGDVMSINASDENSVDIMRDKIKNFVSTFAMSKFKIVHLEEADAISFQGQQALRRMMEEFADNARFILTCNYDNKIIPPLKSRLQQFTFKAPPRDDVVEFAAKILMKEKVKFDLDLLDKYVAIGYPDIRKVVNLLQQYSVDGSLLALSEASSSDDYKFKVLELLEKDNWTEIRKVVCENVSSEEWESVYRFLYENLNRTKKFAKQSSWEEGIVVIADHLYKHSICADPEINAAAMFIRLGLIK